MEKKEVIDNLSKILGKYLTPQNHTVFLFGSRVNGTAQKFSDYDVGISGDPVSPQLYFEIMHDIEESDIPYMVDVVLWDSVSDSFKKVAETSMIPIPILG